MKCWLEKKAKQGNKNRVSMGKVGIIQIKIVLEKEKREGLTLLDTSREGGGLRSMKPDGNT